MSIVSNYKCLNQFLFKTKYILIINFAIFLHFVGPLLEKIIGIINDIPTEGVLSPDFRSPVDILCTVIKQRNY